MLKEAAPSSERRSKFLDKVTTATIPPQYLTSDVISNTYVTLILYASSIFYCIFLMQYTEETFTHYKYVPHVASIGTTTAFSAEALYDAAYNKCDGDMVSYILNNNNELLNQPIEQKFGGGVLHCVTEKGLPDIAQELLQREDIDVNLLNKNGCTPLYYSCSFDKVDVAKVLLEHKADVDIARKVTEKNMITPTANEIDYVVFFHRLHNCVWNVRVVRRHCT